MNTVDKRQQIGRQGEAIAVAYLTDKGYKILQRNWFCATGELDLIVENENRDTLVFVEVRTRRSSRYGTAEESVTPAKQARLIELAQTYLQQMTPSHQAWRIDVVAVHLSRGLPQINHIENAVGW